MKLSQIKQLIKEELFRAYHGRYRFDIDKAYNMIDNGTVKYKVTQLDPNKLKLTDPAFTSIDNKYADELIKQDRIQIVFVSSMVSSPKLDYEKRGYELLEKTYYRI